MVSVGGSVGRGESFVNAGDRVFPRYHFATTLDSDDLETASDIEPERIHANHSRLFDLDLAESECQSTQISFSILIHETAD